MRSSSLIFMVLLASGCASTVPVQDTAEVASRQLLRLEIDVRSAAENFYDRYETQRGFVAQNLRAATEAQNLTNDFRREWEVSGNTEALRLFESVRSSGDLEPGPLSSGKAEKFRVSTEALKKAIEDLGAVSDTLANREAAEAFLRFGHEVQEKYKALKEENDEQR